MENEAYHFLEVFRQEVIKQYLILRYKIFSHIRTAVDKAYLPFKLCRKLFLRRSLSRLLN